MNADGSDVTPITNDPASDIDPDWQPIPSASKTVSVSDGGFSPQSVHLRQGKTIQWNFGGTGSHTATDSSGTGAFGSGAEPPGGAYAATLFAAGTYEAVDDFTSHTGLVKVPIIVDPPSGPTGTTFIITWSSIKAPPGFVFDCQIQLPGSMTWMRFKSQQISRSRTYTPDAPGTYSFRARLRNSATGAHTAWSPSDSIMVGSGRMAREARE
jgi:plastocyanin